MKPDSDSRLPRSPQDPDNLRRLREDALRRVEEDEAMPPAPVYGGPPLPEPPPQGPVPAPVYGGPSLGGGGSLTRRRSLWGLLLAAAAAIGGILAWLLKTRRVFPEEPASPRQQAPVYGGPPIRPPEPAETLTGAIVTANGHLLTAVEGGGLGHPESAPAGAALSTGATTAGPDETFTLVWVAQVERKFALKTPDGHFLTAVNGGGISGPDSAQSPIHTNQTKLGPWERFTITVTAFDGRATIQTPDGRHYVSAVKGGGVAGSSHSPFRTDSTRMGPDAIFQLKSASQLEPPKRPPAPVYGGPPIHRPD